MPLPESDRTQEAAERDAPDLHRTQEMSAADLVSAHAKAVYAKSAPLKAPLPKAAPLKAPRAKAAPFKAARVKSALPKDVPPPMTFRQNAPDADKGQAQEGQAQDTSAEAASTEASAPFGTNAFHTPRRRAWLSALFVLAAAALAVTLARTLTAPPQVLGVRSGRLITLQADPSSPALHGLFLAGPGGKARLLAHEAPPNGKGSREQMAQPALSPDGTQVAFEKQLVRAQNGTQSTDNQIWVMATTPGTTNPPHLVIDLTQQKLKQIRGLAWDSDSSLLFLEDGKSYSVPTETDDPPLVTPLDLHGLTLATNDTVSATGLPVLTDAGTFAYAVQTPHGPQVLTQAGGQTMPGPPASVFALSPDGGKIAFVPPSAPDAIRVYDIAARADGPSIPVRSVWPAFGRREITALHWSPDGAQLAYSLRKSSAPAASLLVVTPASGQTAALPFQVARAAWDWGK